jgi:hypothetical protein
MTTTPTDARLHQAGGRALALRITESLCTFGCG